MIHIIKYAQLGHANHGWLNARHHFSFANYYNPERLRFGVIRVINDDIIKPGYGFDTHPHANMEIITYVRKGAITHKDSQGNIGRTEAGSVQVMSAGKGIFHSEYNNEKEDTLLYQIWIEPNKRNIKARWDLRTFPKEPVTESLNLLVSGREGEALFINQNVDIYAGNMNAGTTIKHRIKHQAYILVSEGIIEINGQILETGDGAEIQDISELELTAKTHTELLVIHC
jgi:quercetin 2,3-dioxygenase